MPRIRILPDILSNKIAAGEVVERPASVVKELVENAIDAGARRIVVAIEAGGRRLIRVADDGAGMDHDDALMALERYATSKIVDDRDLFAIRTLGFRGEALPSIAAVSRLTLVSRPAGQAAATEIQVEGGRILAVREAGAPAGTLVTVKDLFFNTPARRKFLKAIGTEMGHIGDCLAGLALGHPDIDFHLLHNGHTVRRWPVMEDVADRVADVLGRGLRKDLLPLALVNEDARISGWVAVPAVNRSTSRGIYLIVNGRHVKARTLLHAVMQGFHQRLMKGQFPVAACYVEVPPDQVDVNVHPTKHEVRFARQRELHGAVAGAVASALSLAERRQRPWSGVPAGDTPPDATRRVADSIAAFGRRPDPPREYLQAPAADRNPSFMAARNRMADSQLWKEGRFARLSIIGHYRGTYILCESEDGLVFIDQHAAHERICYEQLLRRSEKDAATAQKLLIPETVDLEHREAALLDELLPGLTRLGFEIEPFGGTTYAIKSAPPMLSKGEIGPVIREILEKALENGERTGPESVLDESLKVMACHGAIRARQHLDERQIRALLHQLDACENPSHCPHGRPTWIRWTARDLEKAFGRLV